MALIIICDDCGKGYSTGQQLQDRDKHGSTLYQCPNCFNPTGRTAQS